MQAESSLPGPGIGRAIPYGQPGQPLGPSGRDFSGSGGPGQQKKLQGLPIRLAKCTSKPS
jgi:hypothetical protein